MKHWFVTSLYDYEEVLFFTYEKQIYVKEHTSISETSTASERF